MKIENFSASEIPYDELKVIGFTKERVLDINRDEMERFLSGGKTDLKMLNVNGLRIEAKLSLSRNPDNSVSLMIHPFQKKISNQYNFDNEEIKRLENGEIIAKNINGEKVLFQIDRDTNEVLKKGELNLPSHIGDIELSSDHRERLKMGQSISLTSKNGETITAKLEFGNHSGIDIKNDLDKLKKLYMSGNLNAGAMLEKIYSGNKQQMDKFVQRNGIDSKNIAGSARAAFDRQQQYAFDYHNPGVVSYIHTDQNRAEYMAMDRGRNSSLTI